MEQSTSQGFYLHHLPYFSLLSDIVPGARLLQVGGGGYTAQYASHMGARVTCALGNDNALNITRALYPVPGMELTLAKGEALPFDDNAFDLIMLFEHLGHVQSPGALIAELKRVLAPDGVAIVTLPNFDRDDLREIMGEGAAPQSTLSPGEVYDPLTERFHYVSLLTQAPFLGYLLAQYAEAPGQKAFETLPGAPEPPLFYAFIVSDLEIVLESDRLCPVPFSHLADRLQGGLRHFHRALEHKNNALLELKEEVNHLNTTNEGLLGRADAAEAHLTQLKVAVAEALQNKEAPPLAMLAAALEPPTPKENQASEVKEEEDEALQLSGVSEGELRLLMEGLQGEDIEADLQSLNDGDAPRPSQGSHPQSSLISGDDSDLLFQEDLAPFILPGPVPLSMELRRENARLRERLRQRTFTLTELEARQDALDDLIGSISRSVESHLGELRRWDPRDPMTQQWEEFRDLLGVIRGTANGDTPSRLEAGGQSSHGQGDVTEAFESALRLRREIAALEASLGESQAKLRGAHDEVKGLQSLQRTLESELGERAEAGREMLRERETLRRRLQGADEEILGLQEAVARLEGRKEELKVQLEEKNEEAEAHLRALRDTEERLLALEAESNQLRDALTQAEQGLEDERATLIETAREAEREAHQAALGEAQEASEQALNIAQGHIEVVQAERAEAEAALEAALSSLAKLQEDFNTSQKRLGLAEGAHQNAIDALEAANQARENAETALQRALDTQESTQAALDSANATQRILKADLQDATSRLEAMEAAQAQAQEDASRLAEAKESGAFDTPEAEITALREALATSEAKAIQWEARAEDWQGKALAMKSALAEAEAHGRTLEAALSAADAPQGESSPTGAAQDDGGSNWPPTAEGEAPPQDTGTEALKVEMASMAQALEDAQNEIRTLETERDRDHQELSIAREAARLAEETATLAQAAAARAAEEAATLMAQVTQEGASENNQGLPTNAEALEPAEANGAPKAEPPQEAKGVSETSEPPEAPQSADIDPELPDTAEPEETPAQREQAWSEPSITDPSAKSRLIATLREIKDRLVSGLNADDWEDDTFGPEATQRLPAFSDMAPEPTADEASHLSLTIQQGVERLFALVDLRARNLREAHERANALESNLEAVSRAVAEAEPELTALQAQVAELLDKGEALENTIANLKSTTVTLEDEKRALQTQLDESEEDRARLQEDLAKSLEDRSGAEDLARAEARVAELEHTIQSLNEEAADLEQAQAQLLQLEDAMHQLTAQRKELELRLTKRDEELGELQAEVQRAWSQAIGGGDGGSVSVATDNDDDDTLTDTLDSLESDPVQVLEERVSHLEHALQSKENQVERLLQEMEIKASHNRTLQELVGRHQKELRGVRRRLKDAIERVAQIDARQSKLRGLSLEDLRQRLDELPE